MTPTRRALPLAFVALGFVAPAFVALSALPSTHPAAACPTIATGTTSPLSFDTAQVVVVRQGGRTTFSVSINPNGDPQSFALLLPIPAIPTIDEIKTLDPLIFKSLDGFTAPRHVNDAGCASSGGTDGDGGEGGSEEGDVDVVGDYLVGEYHIVILSATEASELQDWLDTNGYHVPEEATPYLQEYIDQGLYFFAAQVAEAAAVADGTPLSPLSVSYDAETFTIPIRLATVNSPGEQDLIVYALTDRASGEVGIANYPKFEVEDRCIWGAAEDDFRAFYEEQFTAAWTGVADAGWTPEFAGDAWSCNPCTAVSLTEEEVASLGFVGTYDDWYLTRLRMRYTPEQADQEIVFYESNIQAPRVTSYADDTVDDRLCVAECNGVIGDETVDGGVDSGEGTDGTDGADGADGGYTGGAGDGDGDSGKGGCGCTTPGMDGSPSGAPMALGLLGLGAATALSRRRRG
jgi:MYXO-CTERM domain-containing protein